MTPQLKTPIVAEGKDVEPGGRGIAKQLDNRNADRVTQPQKSANLRPVYARYPVPQCAARSPCDSCECKQVAACGGINASGEIDTQAFPERRVPQVRRRSEQIADRVRDPNLMFQIRFVYRFLRWLLGATQPASAPATVARPGMSAQWPRPAPAVGANVFERFPMKGAYFHGFNSPQQGFVPDAVAPSTFETAWTPCAHIPEQVRFGKYVRKRQ
jgi:hypothetical protein